MSNIKYYRFGYIPNPSIKYDILGRLFGHKNIIKRLQAKDIMNALNIQSNEVVLDFGCGAGYFTIEMAKLAQKAYGIDVLPSIENIIIPQSLENKLKYICTKGEQLPFEDNFFDKVLFSEILPMIHNPNLFLREIKRVLKPEGILVLVNGAGHPIIENAYNKNSKFLKFLSKIYPERFPDSYESYCEVLQKSFGTSQNKFFKENEILEILENNDFKVLKIDYSPGFLAGAYLSWSQFIMYLRKGKTLSQENFYIKYFVLSIINKFNKRKHKGGLLCVAKNNKKE